MFDAASVRESVRPLIYPSSLIPRRSDSYPDTGESGETYDVEARFQSVEDLFR